MDKNPLKVHAAFLYIPVEFGFAATTRVGQPNKAGLPGGKLDAGESPREACLRECQEEGWMPLGLSSHPFFEDIVEGNLVYWYTAQGASRMMVYKEQARLRSIVATYDQLADTPFKFKEASQAYYLRGLRLPPNHPLHHIS